MSEKPVYVRKALYMSEKPVYVRKARICHARICHARICQVTLLFPLCLDIFKAILNDKCRLCQGIVCKAVLDRISLVLADRFLNIFETKLVL